MTTDVQKQKHSFQTEVKQLLQLMIHSLYSNKEIFLRELISNSSDALDKLRFLALEDNKLYEGDGELAIRISVNKDAKTITITDNGIGMNKDELATNLGTIAKSGTREFMNSLTGDKAKDSQLIGQFGVGFYSAFIVADKVTVTSRRAGAASEEGACWESTGDGEYTLENAYKATHGTDIVLHLKEDASEFLEDYRVRGIVTRYSDHIAFPVIMKKKPAPVTNDEENKDEIVVEEDETVNKATALWTRSKSELTDDEYKEFYKHISHDFDEPLVWTHNRVEGKTEYTNLLFIPKRAPFDMWQREHRSGLKLYVKRVFIMDDAENLMPSYLRFVSGVIDSNDLPLNVSREILQSNKVVDTIRAGSVKKVLGLLEKMASDEPENYKTFWQQFGQAMKEGPAEDFSNREQIAKLLRFASTHNESGEQNVSLDDYIGRMKEGQEKIYYITAESLAGAKSSPHLEIFRQKGIEVLLLTDKIDEWLTSHLTEYTGKQLQSVAKGALDLDKLTDEETKKHQQEVEEAHKDFIERVKKALGDSVKEVRITHRLTTSPSCIVADEYDMGLQMQRLLKAAGQNVPVSKPILELNPQHQITERLKAEADEQRFSDWSHLLLDQAILADGGQLENPAQFVQRFNQLFLEAGGK